MAKRDLERIESDISWNERRVDLLIFRLEELGIDLGITDPDEHRQMMREIDAFEELAEG